MQPVERDQIHTMLVITIAVYGYVAPCDMLRLYGRSGCSHLLRYSFLLKLQYTKKQIKMCG
jgi:hypothetical protein